MSNNAWLAGNWWQLLLAFVLVVGYIVTLANNHRITNELKAEFVEIKKEIAAHVSAVGLHRGPDFELRMMNIERQLEAASKILGVIGDDVKTVLRSTKHE